MAPPPGARAHLSAPRAPLFVLACATVGFARSHGGCDIATIDARTTNCAATDKPTMACLNGGGAHCSCMHPSREMRACLGNCWLDVMRILCSPEVCGDGVQWG